jgi:hypothetical protein
MMKNPMNWRRAILHRAREINVTPHQVVREFTGMVDTRDLPPLTGQEAKMLASEYPFTARQIRSAFKEAENR